MSCRKLEMTGQAEARSGLSRFIFLPVLRGGTKSVVSDHIVKVLRKSNFCSSSPVLKSLIIHNVQMCCIVVETSGTQSVKVICASVPYLVSLLSRANPKLKRILQDENVAAYLKFFQEADMESVLTSMCTATVIIQKGVQLCYPTLCVTLSRDVVVLAKETLRSLLYAAYNGLVYVFNALSEDLGPMLRSFCARNRDAVKYLAKNLPVAAFATAKGLVLFSLLVRRVFRVLLSFLKRFVASLKCELQQKSIDIDVLDTCQHIYAMFKHFIDSCDLQKYFKIVYKILNESCLPVSKNLISTFFKLSQHFIKRFAPLFKNCFQILLRCVCSVLNENNLQKLFHLICNARPIFNSLLINLKPYYQTLWNLLKHLGTDILIVGRIVLPYIQKCAALLSRTLIDLIVFTLQYRFMIYSSVCVSANHVRKVYPILKQRILNIVQKLKVVAKLAAVLFSQVIYYGLSCSFEVQQKLLELHDKIYPYLYPVTCEVNSTLAASSSEIVAKTVSGANRVLPSFWCALKTITPITFLAASEVLVSSKNSIVIIYPSVLEALAAVRPEVAKSLAVVVEDGNKAFVEVATVSLIASYHVGIAAKNISCQLPVIFKAIDEVTMESLCATSEIFIVSLKAQARVFRDLKKASVVVRSSIKSAEVELVTTLQEARNEVNYIIKDHPEALHFLAALAKEGGIIPHLIAKLNSLSRESFFVASAISISALSKASIALMKYAPKLMVKVLKYISSSSDRNDNPPGIIFKALNKIVYYLECKNARDHLMDIISSAVCNGGRVANKGISYACSELVENIVPLTWNYLKESIPILWKTHCEHISDFWTSVELWCAKLWSLVLDYTPHVWTAFKSACLEMWIITCKVSPGLWDYTLTTVPVVWCSNRQLIQCAWNVYVQTCSSTWNVVVPLSSASWSYTVDSSPKVWLSLSENSKMSWELFCSSAENGWDTVTDISFLSWEVLQKLVSNSWSYGIRPMTLSICCRTSSIVAKSVKFSHAASDKTSKIVTFLNDELLLTSKFGESAIATCDMLMRCVVFSNAKFLRKGSQRKLFDVVKEVSAMPSRMANSYISYFKLGNILNNLIAVSKAPLVPVCRTYSIGQEFLKKYSNISGLRENPLIPVYGLPVFI